MIVADVNLLAYLLLPGPNQQLAEQVYRKDSDWAMPPLWRSEFRNILFLYMRKQGLSTPDAIQTWSHALTLVSPLEQSIMGVSIFAKATDTKLSACDAEYVTLAEQLEAQLVTSEREILSAFPKLAISPGDFVVGG